MQSIIKTIIFLLFILFILWNRLFKNMPKFWKAKSRMYLKQLRNRQRFFKYKDIYMEKAWAYISKKRDKYKWFIYRKYRTFPKPLSKHRFLNNKKRLFRASCK
jgi:hypothetical protein